MMNDKLINQAIEELVEEKWTPGIIAVSGTTNKESIYSYGYTDDENTHLVDKYTLIDLASVTKIFTLFLTMHLCDNGLLDLNRPISYYSDKYANISELKIYELMNFSKILVTPGRLDNDSDNNSISQKIHNVNIQSNETKYSDIGSIVLSTLINDIYGKSFFRNKMKELWQTAGMKRTYWWDELGKDTNIYNYDNEFRIINEKLVTISTPLGVVHDQKARNIGACGHAGVFSCAYDIVTFSKAVLNGEIVSQNAIDIITSNMFDSYDPEGRHYGILCFKKTDNKYNEIPPSAEDNSISISGYTGTYYFFDFLNSKFIFIGGNRLTNRLTTKEINSYPQSTKYLKSTNEFAYKKDKLRDILYL